jgi:diguanylate cyclase (GGDEF)-like protein
MRPDPKASARANADVLLWQAPFRIAVAIVAGGVAYLLQQAGMLAGGGSTLLVVVAAYIALVLGARAVMRRTAAAGPWMVGGVILADLALVFASTVLTAPAGRYERILILAFVVLQLAESYFGGNYAAMGLAAVVAGYAATLGVLLHFGWNIDWPDAIWSLALFTVAFASFIARYGGSRRRLQHIAELFDGAEAGDFSTPYDLAADRNSDAITRLGQAYNRVRMQLASMVLTDPLTECLNRRGLDQALAREIARSARAGSELSLLAIDVDHFKDVNDNYGHMVGDAVLREFGSLLAQTARAGDIVARTGGEEFSMLLPDTEPAGAYRAAIRLCDTIRAHQFMVGSRRLHLTVSVGVVSATGVSTDDAGTHMRIRADEALYAAKRGGRDRARVWNANTPGELLSTSGSASRPHLV